MSLPSPTISQKAVASPGVQLNVTVDEVNVEPGGGSTISPNCGGAGAGGGIGPPVNGCNKMPMFGTPIPVHKSYPSVAEKAPLLPVVISLKAIVRKSG